MRNVIKAAIVALVFTLAAPAAAQDFDAGYEAYDRGDYATALLTLAFFAVIIYFIVDNGLRRALPWQPDQLPAQRQE
jgi:hypothetical protein